MLDSFKNFLLGEAQHVNKWTLMSWPNLTNHKMEGGLGLWDPYTLSQVMGAKLWWHWIGGRPDL